MAKNWTLILYKHLMNWLKLSKRKSICEISTEIICPNTVQKKCFIGQENNIKKNREKRSKNIHRTNSLSKSRSQIFSYFQKKFPNCLPTKATHNSWFDLKKTTNATYLHIAIIQKKAPLFYPAGPVLDILRDKQYYRFT